MKRHVLAIDRREDGGLIVHVEGAPPILVRDSQIAAGIRVGEPLTPAVEAMIVEARYQEALRTGAELGDDELAGPGMLSVRPGDVAVVYRARAETVNLPFALALGAIERLFVQSEPEKRDDWLKRTPGFHVGRGMLHGVRAGGSLPDLWADPDGEESREAELVHAATRFLMALERVLRLQARRHSPARRPAEPAPELVEGSEG